MDKEETWIGKILGIRNVYSQKENCAENLSETKNQKVDYEIESQQKLNVICNGKENVKDKLEDVLAMSEERNHQQAEVNDTNQDSSSKLMGQRIISRASVTKFNKSIKCGRVDKIGGQRRLSLRRMALYEMTRKRYFSQLEESSKQSFESPMFPPEFQVPQEVNSETFAEGQKETKSKNFEMFDTNASFINKDQLHRASTHTELSAIEYHSSTSTEYICPPANLQVTSFTSQKDVKSGEEVWKHFIEFLQINKDSFDRAMKGVNSRENLKISDSQNKSSKVVTKAARESVIHSVGDPFQRDFKFVTNEIQGNLRCGITETCDKNLAPVLKLIEEIRAGFLKEIKESEDLLMNRKEDSQKAKTKQETIKFLKEAKKIQKKLYRYYDILYDDEKLFEVTKNQIVNLNNSKYNLSNITSFYDLPLSVSYIRTFSSLFLLQHQSLLFPNKNSIENIFKYINSENITLAYRRYRERKVMHEGIKELSKNTAIKLTVCFNICLKECHLNMKHGISNSDDSSVDFQNYINDMKIAIKENLNCLYKLIPIGSSVVLPVTKYLAESRKTALFESLFLHKRRSNVFPFSEKNR